MPLLSAFTPCGQLTLSSSLSHSERFYNTLIANLGGNYSVEHGSRAEATCYAQAMRMGHIRHALEHAGGQVGTQCLDEMMADREREYHVIPGPDDSMSTRRATIAARKILPRGARREAVEDALRTLLGASFVAYRTTHPSEIVNWPTNLGDQPMSLQLPEVPRKTVRLAQPVSINLGLSQAAFYTSLDPVGVKLLVGDKITVEPENEGLAETLTVSAVYSNPDRFVATFSKAHGAGCYVTTWPWPMWTGSQRASIIIVKSAAALDRETRRKVDELMQRIVRGVSTWSIVQETSPLSSGPFLLDESPLDATTFTLTTSP